jgi:NAD(P)-dependent dehydrogenase (short-subunit alcohol dehydrogenase family)
VAVSKAILITGCSSGIGKVTAERLARKGHTVYASARSIEGMAGLEAAGCKLVQLDVTDDASARAAVEQIVAAEGAVGALVNNAGYGISGAIETVSLDEMRKEFETNVYGTLRMCQLVLPGMRAQGYGRIVNLSSIAGRVVFPGAGPYASSKYAIEGMTDALRFEVAGFGVAVSIIEPGPIRTNFTSTANASLPAGEDGPYAAFHAAVAKADAETDSSAIAGDPEDVAKAIERAIAARRPKPRYKVTAVARLIPKLKGALPDRAFELFMSTQGERPGPAK